MESEVSQKHFTFKEIEIDGDLQSFCDKLVAIGYSFEYFTDDHQSAVLTGSFAGKDYCEIHVINSKLIDKVWKVLVYVPSRANWSLLKQDYEFFKSVCQKKYGKPDSYEFFQHPYVEGGGKELKALENEMCTFSSFWIMKSGSITVEIQSFMQVSISYEDAINLGLLSAAEEEAAALDI
jgi:hypothetical protein